MTSGQQKFTQLTHHEKYYLDGGDLHLLAENVLFKVHRHFFTRDSAHFRDKLADSDPNGIPRGSSDSSAIILSVSPEDLARFLWVFYNETYSLYDASLKEWESILHLAHEWSFNQVKHLALRQLEKIEISDIERLVLYQKHEVDATLLVPIYAKLCARDELFTLGESVLLGPETSYRIHRAREILRAQPSDGGRSPLPSGLEGDAIKSTIETLLGIAAPPLADKKSTNGSADKTGNNGQNSKAGKGKGGRDSTSNDPNSSSSKPNRRGGNRADGGDGENGGSEP